MCIARTTGGSTETKVLSRDCCGSPSYADATQGVVSLTVISRGGQTTEELLS